MVSKKQQVTNSLIAVLLLFSGLAACSGNQSRQDALKSEVIKIHDRIMPRSEQIYRNKRSLNDLKNHLDSIHVTFPSVDTVVVRRQADSLIRILENADNAMSDWMHEFKTDYTGMEHEEIIRYLEEQKSKIKQVEQDYDESLQGAERFLKKYERN